MDPKSTTVEGISVRRIDIPMRWVERGEGLPLVLIHGMPTSPLLWREVMPRIAGARCLAWEMVGYGASIPEGRERDISLSAQADARSLSAIVLAAQSPRLRRSAIPGCAQGCS
jgi:pimeloyl-ACP methyl ester carboxylesterase